MIMERNEGKIMERNIIDKLNYLTILDFYDNYDKGEVERFFTTENEEIKRVKSEIETMLYSIYDKNKYSVSVNCNFVAINEILEKTERTIIEREFKKIFSENFYRLPYSWVMGRKVSKKTMQEIIEKMR